MSKSNKDFYDSAYQQGHASKYGDLELLTVRNNELWQRTQEWLNTTGLSKQTEAKLLEIGCGMAGLSSIHPGWHGAEYSRSAVERVKAIQGPETPIFEADAQNLPCDDRSYDAVFTWAALEHIPNPDKVLTEIDRVLRGGAKD